MSKEKQDESLKLLSCLPRLKVVAFSSNVHTHTLTHYVLLVSQILSKKKIVSTLTTHTHTLRQIVVTHTTHKHTITQIVVTHTTHTHTITQIVGTHTTHPQHYNMWWLQ